MTPDVTVNVPLPGHPYDIFIGNDIGSFLKEWIVRIFPEKKVYAVVDEYFHSLYGEDLENLFGDFDYFLLPLSVSEDVKNHETLFTVYDFLMENECDRDSLIVLVGGGIIGDLGGFAASTYMRGVRYVNVPTTLLAQVDSSVGGKTGVNYREGKNYVGAFHQPDGVFIDVKYLKTLDDRNFRAGFAEIIKAGVIGDKTLVDMLRGKTFQDIRGDDRLLVDLIEKSVSFKAKIVVEDERESGLRRILNFGHTIGHAIEEATDYGTFLHGEAVAAGMAMESQICLIAGLCTEETRNVVMGLLEDIGYDYLPEKIDYSHMISLVGKDKKKERKSISVPVLRELGRVELKSFDIAEYERLATESLKFLRGFREMTMGTKLRFEVMEDVISLEKQGRLSEAEDLVKKYLQNDPGNGKLTLLLARLQRKQGRLSEALSTLDGLLEANPSNQDAVKLRKEIEEQVADMEDVPEAAAASPSERVIQIEDEVFHIEGILEEEGEVEADEVFRGDVEEEEAWEEEEDGEAIPVYTTSMAEVLMKGGEPDKAVDVLKKVLSEDPENREAELLLEKAERLIEKKRRGEKIIDALEKFGKKISEVFE